MPSRWSEYRTKTNDELDERFFNTRFRSIDQRLATIEDQLLALEGEQTNFVRDLVASMNSASADTLAAFINAAGEAIETVQSAQAEIDALEAEVQSLLGTLGTEFQVDCGEY